MLEDYDTWTDTDGKFAEPGTEFVFDPRQETDDDEPEEQSEDTRSDPAESVEAEELQQSLDDDLQDEEDQFLMKDGEVV